MAQFIALPRTQRGGKVLINLDQAIHIQAVGPAVSRITFVGGTIIEVEEAYERLEALVGSKAG